MRAVKKDSINILSSFSGGTLTRPDGTTELLNDNGDLWWSVLGGGGGTYGVVTQFKLKLYDAPPEGFVRLLMRFIIFKNGECAGAAKEVNELENQKFCVIKSAEIEIEIADRDSCTVLVS